MSMSASNSSSFCVVEDAADVGVVELFVVECFDLEEVTLMGILVFADVNNLLVELLAVVAVGVVDDVLLPPTVAFL